MAEEDWAIVRPSSDSTLDGPIVALRTVYNDGPDSEGLTPADHWIRREREYAPNEIPDDAWLTPARGRRLGDLVSYEDEEARRWWESPTYSSITDAIVVWAAAAGAVMQPYIPGELAHLARTAGVSMAPGYSGSRGVEDGWNWLRWALRMACSRADEVVRGLGPAPKRPRLDEYGLHWRTSVTVSLLPSGDRGWYVVVDGEHRVRTDAAAAEVARLGG